MIYVSNVISTILQLYIAHNLFFYLLRTVRIQAKYRLIILFVICLLDSFSAIYADKSSFQLPIILLLSIFAISLTYNGRLFIKFMLSVLLTVVFALCEICAGMIIVSLTHLDMNTITTANHTLYLFGVLLSNLLAFFIVKLIGYISHITQVKLSLTLLIVLFLTSFASLCPLYIIGMYTYNFTGLQNTVTVIVISVILIASNLVLFHIYEVQLRHEQQRAEYEYMTRQFGLQAQYYKKLVDEQENINKTIHDFKNNLLAIEGCIAGGDTQGATRRIEEICRTLNDRTKIITSNIIVDTILNAKEKEAANAGLDFKIVASAFPDSTVDAFDLGIILGNALDNAIEACSKIAGDKNKEISAKILHIEDYISIVIENTVDKPVQIINGMIASTKNDAFHGYGIKNIKALVEKYDGDVQLTYEADRFSINMLLKSS